MSVWESYGTSMNVILSFGKKNKPQETPKFVNKDKPHLSICLPLLYLCIWVQRTALRCITRLEWMIFGGWCHFSALSVLYVHLLYLNMTTIGMRKIPVQVQMPQITLEALRLMFAPSQCTHPTRIHGYLFVGCPDVPSDLLLSFTKHTCFSSCGSEVKKLPVYFLHLPYKL